MKTHVFSSFLILLLTFVLLTLTLETQAEQLHSWVEPNPSHPFQDGAARTEPFYTYASKVAHRTQSTSPYGPSGTFWQVSGAATASANAQPSLPRPEDRTREWNVVAKLRVTGDNDTLTPHSGDSLPIQMIGNPRYEWSEKVLRSTDDTTQAKTVRKAHPVFYKNPMWGPTEQRYLDVETESAKSEISSSPTGLDADPWAKAVLEVSRRMNLAAPIDGSPFTSVTPACSSSGAGHTCRSNSGSTNSGSTNSGSINGGSGSGSRPRCALGAFNLCNDGGGCSFQGSSTAAGACGHLWCLCRSGSTGGSNNGGSTGGSNNGGSTPTVQCANNYIGAGACTSNRVVSSSSTEHRTTCSTHGNYWSCNQTAKTYHQSRTCTRCSLSYQNCTNHSSACQNTRWHTQSSNPSGGSNNGGSSNGGSTGGSNNGGSSNGGSTTTPTPTTPTPTTPTVQCANNYIGSGACTSNRVVTSSSTEHRTTCSTHGNYWACNATAKAYHQSRTCTRCGLSYQNCTNHTSACQNTRWHTQESNPYVTGACGDTYRKSAAGSHDSTMCSDTTCTSRSYYECQSHTHTYSSSNGGSSNSGSSNSGSDSDYDDDDDDTSVQCPANSWTSCGGTSSHATTCAAGHTYYTCNSNAVSTHSQHTANVVCPANSWTSCGGTSSHATTCGQGHIYYTCNSNAVAYHSGH